MPTKIGVIGCGNIFKAYAKGATHHEALDLVACADIDMERARARAEEFKVPCACTVDELLGRDDIACVVNLTTPQHHVAVDRQILQAGKHAYAEKPLALDRKTGAQAVTLAAKKGLLLGSAPDTFLGGGLQTCRKLVDEGAIGRPIAATACMACHGHESWHPDPEFYYLKGGGPVLDMGPYYLTALISILGPVKRVAACCGRAFDERLITSEPKTGILMPVEVSTHVVGVLEFCQGTLCNLVMSFDTWKHHQPKLELHGTEGSLGLPDPNGFKGPVTLSRRGKDWEEVALTHAENMRGAGVADLVLAAQEGRAPRASGELAYHVLDVMLALHDSQESGGFVDLKSTCERPAPLAPYLPEGVIR